MTLKTELDDYLTMEARKLAEAEKLTNKLGTFIFGRFDPRWWRTRNELHRVIRSFKLCDERYNVVLPTLNISKK